MTRDDILRMAREQGLPETEVEGVFRVNSDDLGRMLAAEREACANVAEQFGPNRPIVAARPSERIVGRWEGEQAASSSIAAAIRARGLV